MKKASFSKVVQREKLVACGTQVLLEHSPGLVGFCDVEYWIDNNHNNQIFTRF